MSAKDGKYWDEGIDLVSGCTPVSEGCLNCWHRAGLKRWGKQNPEGVIIHPERLERLKKGKPRIISIWADLFHPVVSDDFIGQALDAAAKGPHQVLVLTKRAERMAWFFAHCPIPDNVWPGVTVESQNQAHRLWWLKRIDCPRKWVSVEPVLGYVRLEESLSWLSWVVVGCETGPGARICAPTNKHIITVVDQCQAANVPVWVKSFVEFGKPTARDHGSTDWIVRQWPAGMRLQNSPTVRRSDCPTEAL